MITDISFIRQHTGSTITLPVESDYDQTVQEMPGWQIIGHTVSIGYTYKLTDIPEKTDD